MNIIAGINHWQVPKPDDWYCIHLLVSNPLSLFNYVQACILQQFKETTDVLQGQHYPTLPLIAPAIQNLLRFLQEDDSPEFAFGMNEFACHTYLNSPASYLVCGLPDLHKMVSFSRTTEERSRHSPDWNGREIWTEGHREALAGRCIVSSEAQDTELAG